MSYSGYLFLALGTYALVKCIAGQKDTDAINYLSETCHGDCFEAQEDFKKVEFESHNVKAALCPLSKKIMRKPVSVHGIDYDDATIRRYLRTHHNRDPFGRYVDMFNIRHFKASSEPVKKIAKRS